MAGTRSRVARSGAHLPPVRPAPALPARRRALRGAAQEDEPANGLTSRARSRAGTRRCAQGTIPGGEGRLGKGAGPAKFPSEIGYLGPRARLEVARLSV